MHAWREDQIRPVAGLMGPDASFVKLSAVAKAFAISSANMDSAHALCDVLTAASRVPPRGAFRMP